ncbi:MULTISPECIES: nucleotidyltransferase domain-containing protein [unclassified Microbacterium]|uniref:nucleotidyltransferase domain-containing protein n=1 Tax=unclassified Microbacterium TaxID=2609290 RepID=UPI0021A75D1A|nr:MULTISPECIES: nucleotidyltransferase domain-containing protein [unclassified Microbacterium]MCT1364854.1 nucleotidyltransferase domain-containing protein [Microbacterium sp. p3-SID131]MCT1377537.1 nucleotidyltransferase domain-containing protein [Microbacterium sp. p3-SID337]
MDQAERIERFLAARYPRAGIAIVAGSTARGERTPTSDIDLLLIDDDLFADVSQVSEAATHAFEDEIFEVFAYTVEGFREWADRGVAQHRPVIAHMLVEGAAIRSTPALAELRTRWSAVLALGSVLSETESRIRRYVITDLLDDLQDATDPLEQRVVAGLLFERMAELMLLAGGQWIGSGKWLPRRLRAWSPERADQLSTPLLAGDFPGFAARVDEELTMAGGRVQAGFVR